MKENQILHVLNICNQWGNSGCKKYSKHYYHNIKVKLYQKKKNKKQNGLWRESEVQERSFKYPLMLSVRAQLMVKEAARLTDVGWLSKVYLLLMALPMFNNDNRVVIQSNTSRMIKVEIEIEIEIKLQH